ncbi:MULTISPECIES: EexN family lipoprotein [Aeromonas]|uniref:EexN family lipoprotein n=1 Tax=Aeromonas TaxID=642 RepID=UPI00211D5496|nr:EexN family lipoprotein [Aeromonas veronii]UUM70427.1 EexN family lipoprotein [Aeromonas veronii]
MFYLWVIKKNKLLLVVPFTMLLTACGPTSVENFMKDPKLLNETLQECTLKIAQGKDANSEECKNAIEAQQRMATNLMKNMLGQ